MMVLGHYKVKRPCQERLFFRQSLFFELNGGRDLSEKSGAEKHSATPMNLRVSLDNETVIFSDSYSGA